MAKLLMVLTGLWLAISGYMFMTARMNNQPVVIEKILSEAFYYSAIAFAVYHFATRNKRPRGQTPPESREGKAVEQNTGGADEV